MFAPFLKNHKRQCPVLSAPGKKAFLLFLCSFTFLLIRAQTCSSSGYKSAGTFTTDNSIGQYNFGTPSNAQSSDNSRATASAIISLLSGDTYYLKATGFNFSIPSYASICGISVEIEHRATGVILTAAVRDNEVKLIKGGVITGNNLAQGGDWGTTDSYSTYGGNNNKWGTTLTPSDINASNFGVAISAQIIALVAALPTADIDHIRMNVHFDLTLPVRLDFFTAAKNKNKVLLEWKTAEEEDHASITLERSINNVDWQPLNKYDQSSHSTGKSYQYLDILSRDGEYEYRLKLRSAAGVTVYSEIKKIQYSASSISIFPNPSTDYIYVENTGTKEISIYNAGLQKIKAPIERIGSSAYRVNTVALMPGIYFVSTGEQTLRFLKK